MILLSSPLKMTPWKPRQAYIFFSPNWDIHNQNSQLKRFEKNLSSAFVDDERP